MSKAVAVVRYKGSPREVGVAAGETLSGRLEGNIARWIDAVDAAFGVDRSRLRRDALPWFRKLPSHFREEIEGMAEGSGLPPRRLAEWCLVDSLAGGGCSGFVLLIDGMAWVARNNDYILPEVWRHVTIREIEGRIPALMFGMEGDLFSSTGVNRERLWLHYNWARAWDAPESGTDGLPPYVFLREALETCRSMGEVERLLSSTARDGGMVLFAVDGKGSDFALFDCARAAHRRREIAGDRIAGTNLYHSTAVPEGFPDHSGCPRLRRMEEFLEEGLEGEPPDALVRLLADPLVEREEERATTVYSTVACPAVGSIWFSGGVPRSAGRGNWEPVPWPW